VATLLLEHLEAASDGEKEDRRREEDANVMVCLAYGFESGRGCHVGLSISRQIKGSAAVRQAERGTRSHRALAY
jgi:hypothetical protein